MVGAEILNEVYSVILDRKLNPKPESYVCSLYKAGEDKILEKIGEEAVELILASKTNSQDKIVFETADLIFHTLVLFGSKGIPIEAVFEELKRRRK
ncbi:MAG: phosphoribosyl-ATP diphosphatase [Euryarchaeota archaeon]|nr:phosphoribosyl-ATP diphosphatase [Euryarchaeota archaeon]